MLEIHNLILQYRTHLIDIHALHSQFLGDIVIFLLLRLRKLISSHGISPVFPCMVISSTGFLI